MLIEILRERLVGAILEFLPNEGILALGDIRVALEHELDNAGPEALVALKDRLLTDAGWEYSPRDPLTQRIHHVLADRFVTPDSRLEGVEHLAAVMDARVAILANHLSYSDANCVEILLQRAGAPALANRLTAIAGPKVFTSQQRRFSSLCFGTIQTPQSTEVSSEEAALSAREVARAARHSIEIAHGRLVAGDALVLFGEGTRSRSGGMQPMLPAVTRYLEVPDTWVLPIGLTGSESLFPVGGATIQPARIVGRVGRPFPANAILSAANGDRRLVMDSIGLAIARLLPPAYQGVYAKGEDFPAARDLLQSVEAAS